MASPNDMNVDAPSDLQDIPENAMHLIPPAEGDYPDRDTLFQAVNLHASEHGYQVVIKSSSGSTDKKPGRKNKVWLRCDRGGQYRPRNGLTEENRKRRRTSRLVDCPFQLLASAHPGFWRLTVLNPNHNHGPSLEKAKKTPHPKIRRGQLHAAPYDWPHDATFTPYSTALVIIDMQKDFCYPGGYMAAEGHNVSAFRALIPNIQRLLMAFRAKEFPVYFTRQGHRSDLSTLSPRESHRARNNTRGGGVGAPGPMGRLLIRGEGGWNIVDELAPTNKEPVIDKPGGSAFVHTEFELILRNRKIRNLVLVGVTTDICVSSTMRDASARTFDCLLVEDATAAADPALHASTIASAKMEGGIIGAVSKVDDVIHAVTTYKPPKKTTPHAGGSQMSPPEMSPDMSPPQMAS
ncbi:isochorismatase family hydrolase [Penicillium verhagenii]|uniref:isochorismatase family hydrolase n=1 Tax=Penicillium verhagenii TaxID=1562060 RepID=UPI002545AE94|nr:isochorismatase family hydrolase [Penicillium verhagenii]KAJ5921115.1 isochorismatase family hydrolase [Penicillium verhagenii]